MKEFIASSSSAAKPVLNNELKLILKLRENRNSDDAPAWLQPDSIPTFEVAYPGPKWYPVNEEISKEMYTAYLANTAGHYTEPLTANGKGGTRKYIVDWEQMIQTNIENGRQRSVRFRGLQQRGEYGPILIGKLR